MADPEYIIKKLIKASKRKTLQGKINDIIDLIFHPFFGKTNGLAEIADFLAHSLNEGEFDLDKFFRYNFDSLLKSLMVKKHGRKSRTKKRTG